MEIHKQLPTNTLFPSLPFPSLYHPLPLNLKFSHYKGLWQQDSKVLATTTTTTTKRMPANIGREKERENQGCKF